MNTLEGMTGNNVETLRQGLAANAAFSLATGLLLAIAPSTVGGWLGVDIDGWLRLLGLGLIGHFGILAVIARRPHPTALARLNLAMIAPYPLIMLAVVAAGLVDRGLGQALLLTDGFVVGLFAFIQVRGLRERTLVS